MADAIVPLAVGHFREMRDELRALRADMKSGFDDMKRRLHRVEQSVVGLKRDEAETASELTDHRGVPDQLIARIELLESRQPSS